MILDEKAKSDKSYIQDKELRDFIYDYTAGDYGTAVTYTQYIADGYDEKEALKRIKNHSHDDSYFENQVRLAKKLQNEINKSEYDMPLIRFEKTQMRSDFYGNLSNDQKEYKVGEELKWGIRSASSNENYFEKIASGNDKISLEHFASAYPYTYTEYKILGKKKSLDISKYSEFPDQKEHLINGTFIVEKVENYVPKIVYDKKSVTFKEYLENNNYTYKTRLSKKSGEEIIEIKDNSGKEIYSQKTSKFVENIQYDLKFKLKLNNEDITFNKIINGDIPYKIEEIENKKKSTYGVERQIVTLRQKN